jgi:MoxR-like ATPase
MRASRGIALLRGRSYVHCQDIYDIAYDVLNHRLVLSYKALSEGIDADAILQELLGTVKATQQHGGALHQNQPPVTAPQQPAAWY